MSETAAKPVALTIQERSLQKYLLTTAVPFKDGGGAVFPNGFLARGYRLDEWQFDRYRAAVDQTMLSAAAAKRKWVMLGAMAAYIFVLVAVAFVLPAMRADPALAPYIGLWTPIFVTLFAATALIAVLHLVRRRAMPFVQDIKDAPRVGRFNFLRERALALLASGHVRLPALYIRIVLYCGLVAFLLASDLILAERLVIRIAISFLLLYSTSHRLYFVIIYWSFRLRHGRAPTMRDLRLVEPPATQAA